MSAIKFYVLCALMYDNRFYIKFVISEIKTSNKLEPVKTIVKDYRCIIEVWLLSCSTQVCE